MLRMIRVVCGKEVRDHARDLRSLAGALALPVLGPIVVFLVFDFIADLERDRPLEVAVVGREHGPKLAEYLQAHGVRLLPPPAVPEEAVQQGEVDMVLIIEPEYARRFRSGRPAPVQLLQDSSRSRARKNVRRVEELLRAYSGEIGTMRLLVRGLTPDLATPLSIERVDLATPEKLAANLLNMVPLFLMLAALVGGMNVAIDTTAGERERGSLEPLLLNPVPRGALVLGKWLATSLAGLLVTLVTLAGFVGALAFLPLEDVGLRVVFGPREAGVVLAAILPLALLGAAVQMLVATFARSFKEAQTYLNLLNLVPMVPSMLLMFSPVEDAWWTPFVPTVAQITAVVDVMRGEAVSAARLGAIWASSLVPTAACLLVLTRLLKSERIVFGR
ncbi:MAG: ABC transporter permease [Deltaproteobacteria bacterium]|nr:MAG: ABC transporter permease [Deltaproteobacteria bacterium]